MQSSHRFLDMFLLLSVNRLVRDGGEHRFHRRIAARQLANRQALALSSAPARCRLRPPVFCLPQRVNTANEAFSVITIDAPEIAKHL